MKALVEDRYFCSTASFQTQRITEIKTSEDGTITIPKPNKLNIPHPYYSKKYPKKDITGDYSNSIILQIIKE